VALALPQPAGAVLQCITACILLDAAAVAVPTFAMVVHSRRLPAVSGGNSTRRRGGAAAPFRESLEGGLASVCIRRRCDELLRLSPAQLGPALIPNTNPAPALVFPTYWGLWGGVQVTVGMSGSRLRPLTSHKCRSAGRPLRIIAD